MNKSARVLSVFSLVMINIIAVDSLRSLPFSAEFGFSLIFYYFICAILFFIPTALIAAMLATAWPNKGGIYVWVREAFGDLAGFIIIWLQWVYNVVWYPTILSFIAGAFAFLINPSLADNKVYMLSVVMSVFWLATLINFWGMRASSLVSTIGALLGTLLPMLLIIMLGIVWYASGNPSQIIFSPHALLPSWDVSHFVFVVAVLFGLVGMEMSAVHADEVKDPARAYPRAILISVVIILLSLVLSSLAIAMVVPNKALNVVTGLEQAFAIFFQHFHLMWLLFPIVIFMIIGGISSVTTWIIGPTKGLLVAVNDGSAPAFFAKANKHGVPIVILLLQAIIFSIMCSVYLLEPSVSSSYWVLTAVTAQLAMLFYIGMFLAAIKLRHRLPETRSSFRIPGGQFGIWLTAIFGLIAAVAAIVIGFIPPAGMNVGSIWVYELIILFGLLVLCLPPVIIYYITQFTKKRLV